MNRRTVSDVLSHELGHAFATLALRGGVASMAAGEQKFGTFALGLFGYTKSVPPMPMVKGSEADKLWGVAVSLAGGAWEEAQAGHPMTVDETGSSADFKQAAALSLGLKTKLVTVWGGLVAGFSQPEVAAAIHSALEKLMAEDAAKLPAEKLAAAAVKALRASGAEAAIKAFLAAAEGPWTRN